MCEQDTRFIVAREQTLATMNYLHKVCKEKVYNKVCAVHDILNNMLQNNVNSLNQVTTFSKCVAAILFTILPFIGAYVGYTLAPEKIIEIEKVVFSEKPAQVSRVSDITISTTTIMNNVVEVLLSDGIKKVAAQGLAAEDVSDIYMIETYFKTFISPNNKFVALQAIGFEDYFVSIYNVDSGLSEEKIYGEVVHWTNDGRLEINACNLAGEECRQYVSKSAEDPSVLEEVTGR